jgi:hypothetical protein
MAWWWQRPSIRRWPATGEMGKPTRSKPVSSGSDFGVRRGSAHRSRDAHGISGRVGKLDGDSVAQRSMAAVDEL